MMKNGYFYKAASCIVILMLVFSCGTSKPRQSNKRTANNRVQSKNKPQRIQKVNRKDDFMLSFDEESNSKKGTQAKKKDEDKKNSSKNVLGFQLSSKDNTKLYRFAEEWHGTPHKLGGCSRKGIDCSCFVLTAYREVYGIDLSRSAVDIAKETQQVKRGQLKEGDLVFFKTGGNKVSHVGIYLKDNKFVHASTSKGVMVSDLDETYWKKTFYLAGRHKKL